MKKYAFSCILGILLRFLSLRWRLHYLLLSPSLITKRKIAFRVLFGIRPISSRDIARAYRSLLLLSLENGLSYDDLQKLTKSQDYFAIPHEGSLRLKQLANRFWWLKLICKGSLIAINCQRELLRFEIDRILVKPPSYWHPAYLRSPRDRLIEGLAPRNNQTSAHEIIIYVIPSPLGICWRSPKTLLAALFNYFVPGKWHYIGHLGIELRKNGETIALTGMTGDTNFRVLREFFMGKVGLAWFFNTFRGRLERSSEMARDIVMHAKYRRLAYIRCAVPEKVYCRADEFLQSWWADGTFQKYGLWQTPMKQDGAGCASFAVAFLQELGLADYRWMRSWLKTIRIPNAWIGGVKNGQRVSCLRLALEMSLTKNGNHWSRRFEEKHFRLSFFDPDSIYRWIHRNSRIRMRIGKDYRILAEKYASARGVRFEFTQFGPRASQIRL